MKDRIEKARRFLEPALEYAQGTHTYADVARDLETGQSQLWDTERAAAVTEVHLTPQRKTCHVFLGGGDLDEMPRLIAAIEWWARSIGCDRITMAGRRGWERTFLRDEGFSPAWTVLAKDLT